MNLGIGRRRARCQEIEIAALVGLRHVLRAPARRSRAGTSAPAAATPPAGARAPRRSTCSVSRRARHVELDHVAVLDERERAADARLRRDVQHAGAVARAAHPRVRDAHHVANARARAASSGSAAVPTRASRARRSGRRASAPAPSSRRRADSGRRCARPGRCSRQTRRRGRVCRCRRGSAAGGLITAPSGARLPRSTASVSERDERASSGVRMTSVVERRPRRRCSRRASGRSTVQRLTIDQIAQIREQRAQPAGVEEVLHQVLARRADVGEERRLPGDRVERVEIERARRRGAPSRSR